MNIIRDEVFYDRQLELAKKLAHVLGNKIKEIKTTEYLYPYEGPFDKKLSYSEVRQANRKKRINVTVNVKIKLIEKFKIKLIEFYQFF